MIIAKPIGGLGNQMFAYAAAYAAAKRLETELRIDANNYSAYRPWPYLLGRLKVPQQMIDTSFASKMGRIRRYLGVRYPAPQVYHEPHFHFDEAFLRLREPIELNGYFQSWRYFEGHEEALRGLFCPREELAQRSKRLLDTINSTECAVSVHVRRGDYTRPGAKQVHGLLSADYYRRAVSLITALNPSAEFFLFSDDPDWARHNILVGRSIVVDGDASRPWEDMHLMASCRHHIIANSSFSWWGAFLNSNDAKIVVAPRQWFSAETSRVNNICDLHPPGWWLL